MTLAFRLIAFNVKFILLQGHTVARAKPQKTLLTYASSKPRRHLLFIDTHNLLFLTPTHTDKHSRLANSQINQTLPTFRGSQSSAYHIKKERDRMMGNRAVLNAYLSWTIIFALLISLLLQTTRAQFAVSFFSAISGLIVHVHVKVQIKYAFIG